MGAQEQDPGEHRYEACTDPWCQRFPCRVYREGLAEGRERGYAEGYAHGQADALGRSS